jgi:hypothetical protein
VGVRCRGGSCARHPWNRRCSRRTGSAAGGCIDKRRLVGSRGAGAPRYRQARTDGLLFAAVLSVLGAVLLVLLVSVGWKARPSLLPKEYQTFTACGAVQLNAGERWRGQRIRVNGQVDELTSDDVRGMLSLACPDGGRVWVKLYDFAELKKAESYGLTGPNSRRGWWGTSATVEGTVETTHDGKRIVLSDALLLRLWQAIW